MTSLLAALLLALAAPQHAEPASPAVDTAPHGAPGVSRGAEGHPVKGHAPAGLEQELRTMESEGSGEHEETLAGALLSHVSDGYLLEYPGVCHGGFQWNCETNLKHVFGSALVFGRLDMTPTKHTLALWLASVLLVALFLLAGRKRALVPRGLYNFLELLVQFVRDEIAVKNIGAEDAARFTPFLCTAFFFILIVNLLGLLPWSATATANISVTLVLAVFTFLATQWAAIRSQGVSGYLAHLTGGVHWGLWVIMVPVEVLGLFTKPFALTIRLFANMLAGHFVILSLLGLIVVLKSPLIALGSVPMALAIFMLELFVAFVQAYIFTMLSSLFIGQGLTHHGHDEEGHGHAAPGMGSVDHGSHVAGKAPGHG